MCKGSAVYYKLYYYVYINKRVRRVNTSHVVKFESGHQAIAAAVARNVLFRCPFRVVGRIRSDHCACVKYALGLPVRIAFTTSTALSLTI